MRPQTNLIPEVHVFDVVAEKRFQNEQNISFVTTLVSRNASIDLIVALGSHGEMAGY